MTFVTVYCSIFKRSVQRLVPQISIPLYSIAILVYRRLLRSKYRIHNSLS